ncbi:TPA: ABC transporter substrate-binding protein [bacterium]|nr:ABC transporter substrate-binding protein [bacterium]
MKSQRYIMLTLLMIFAFALETYSSTPPKYGGVLRFAILQSNISLDPIKILTPTEYYIADSIFDGLIRYGTNQKIIGNIASSWDISEDQSIFTFHIAESARFHNTRKINANDIKYSWQRSIRNADYDFLEQSGLMQISGANFYRQNKSNSVKGIQVINDNTIQITLAQTDDSFLSKLGNPLTWILPKDSAEKTDFDKNPVGSGPFKIAPISETEGEILNLIANEEYLWGRPYIDRIIFVSASDLGSLLLRFETGDLDCLEVPNIEFGRFRNSPGWSSQLKGFSDNQIVCLKVNKKSFVDKTDIASILKDGIDVKSILGMLYNQGNSLSDRIYQLERAKKNAAEIQNKRMKLIVLDSENERKIADRISFDLAKTGIILDILPMNRQDFDKALKDASYSLSLILLSAYFNDVDTLNRASYVPLFYQNTNFLQKSEIQGLSESSRNRIIQLDNAYIFKPKTLD